MSGTRKTNNYVAKYMNRYNKAATMIDKKRESKKKGEYADELYERNDYRNRSDLHEQSH